MEAVIVPVTEKDMNSLIKYNITDAAIYEMKRQCSNLAIIDNASYKAVTEAIAIVRTKRTDVEKKRKELKANALEFGKRVDAEAKRITELLLEIEEPLKNLKKEEDDKREFEKREAERKEAERTAGIQARIDEIRAKIPEVPTSSDKLLDIIFEVDSIEIGEPIFQGMVGQAALAKSATLDKLNVLLENRLKWEEEEKKRKEEIARLEQLRVEQEKAEVERRIKEVEERARKDAEEKAMRAEQEKIEAEKRAIEAEKARMETEKRVEWERKEREEKERLSRIEETRKGREIMLLAVEGDYEGDDLGMIPQEQFNSIYEKYREIFDLEQTRLATEAEEKTRKDREEFERQAKERAEREAREKLERKERERKAMEEAEEAERKRHEALKPDKEKLVGFAIAIGQIECPEVNDERCKDIIIEAMMMIVDIVKFINDKAADL